MILKLSVNNQSVESSGITKDYKDALCEYVWNSFEANATAVAIDCIPNELTGSAEIVITDNGDGIAYDSLERTFGAFLASQKNSRSLQIKTKANKGKGRFSCFSFASLAEWSTVTATPDGNIAYTISLENADKNQCDVSDPAPTTRSTGTRLIISGIDGICEDDVSFAQLEDTMLKAFAWYLYLNKDKKIVLTINGTELDYRKYINTDASVEKEILISRIPFKIALIVWNEKITENFSVYFLDEEGVVRSKDTTTFNRNTVNFNHSVFVTSPFFLGRDGITLKGKRVELDGQTALNEYDEDKKVLKELSKEIQDVIEESLHKHMAAQVDKAIARMEARDSFPTFPNDFYGALRKKDLVQVTKEIYRIQPRIFHNLKPIQEKSLLGFLNLLLSSEERENVLSIMDYVRKQPLFNSQYRRWKFIAVCSAVDDDVKARYDSQKSKGKKGLVAEIDNYEVYALTWDDVFQSFDLRHAFLLDKLKMDKEAIAAEIAQTAGDEKSKDTADALTALVAN